MKAISMKILILFVFNLVLLSSQNLSAQPFYPNCGNVNCTTATQWQYGNDWLLPNFVVTEITTGVPPYQVVIQCTTTVHIDFRWRICDGKYEFELSKFWWDYNQCPIDYNDPNFTAKMKALHERLYVALIHDFYADQLNPFGNHDINCPPYCCPNNFVSTSMSAASCYLLAIEWNQTSTSSSGRVLINASLGIETYLDDVPAGATPYISVENCNVTTCCTRTYKVCRNGSQGDLVIQDDVQPPLPSPTECIVGTGFTCFPRCDE